MSSLRKHPVTLSLILWSICLITFVTIRVVAAPEILTEMNGPASSFLIAIVGILNWLLIFAAKLLGRSE